MIVNFSLSMSGAKDIPVNSMTVHDSVSSLFTIECVFSCDPTKVNLDAVLGEEASIKVSMGNDKRNFSGVVENVSQSAIDHYKLNDVRTMVYKVTIRPRLWLLANTNNYKVFQKQSTMDIVQKILQEHKVKIKDSTQKSGKAKILLSTDWTD